MKNIIGIVVSILIIAVSVDWMIAIPESDASLFLFLLAVFALLVFYFFLMKIIEEHRMKEWYKQWDKK